MSSRPLIEPLDAAERLSDEDMAARREAEHLACAIAAQAQRSGQALASIPGVCTNCGERCLPRAVYCDADCRSMHEARVKRQARGSRGA